MVEPVDFVVVVAVVGRPPAVVAAGASLPSPGGRSVEQAFALVDLDGY